MEDYNAYYLALYGLHHSDSNPLLKGVVTVFFDIYTILLGLITVASTIALFGELMNSLFGIPVMVGSLGGVFLFAVLTIYGAGFLRKFNTVMTLTLVTCMVIMLVAVLAKRGGLYLERLGNFEIGYDWSGTTLKLHFATFLSYCFGTSAWGSTLCNYSEKIRTQRSAIGTGLLIGTLVTMLFFLTSSIVLPFLPEMFNATPILSICQTYLSPVLTAVYWFVVIFSISSTAPTFTYNVSNRFSKFWKTEAVSQRTKFFVLSLMFLLLCYGVSSVGLMDIAKKGQSAMGGIAGLAMAIPLLISIVRVRKRDMNQCH